MKTLLRLTLLLLFGSFLISCSQLKTENDPRIKEAELTYKIMRQYMVAHEFRRSNLWGSEYLKLAKEIYGPDSEEVKDGKSRLGAMALVVILERRIDAQKRFKETLTQLMKSLKARDDNMPLLCESCYNQSFLLNGPNHEITRGIKIFLEEFGTTRAIALNDSGGSQSRAEWISGKQKLNAMLSKSLESKRSAWEKQFLETFDQFSESFETNEHNNTKGSILDLFELTRQIYDLDEDAREGIVDFINKLYTDEDTRLDAHKSAYRKKVAEDETKEKIVTRIVRNLHSKTFDFEDANQVKKAVFYVEASCLIAKEELGIDSPVYRDCIGELASYKDESKNADKVATHVVYYSPTFTQIGYTWNDLESAEFNSETVITHEDNEKTTISEGDGVPAKLPLIIASRFTSSINKYDIPDLEIAEQIKVFGDYTFASWRNWLSRATIALYLEHELVFTAQLGLATSTSALNQYDDDVDFEAPPPGTDIDDDGDPDLLIFDWSGGMHCCFTIYHISLGEVPTLVAKIDAGHSIPRFEDIEGNGIFEMLLQDTSYAYWNACFAESPAPLVIYSIQNECYEINGELMKKYTLNRNDSDDFVCEIEPEGFQTRIQELKNGYVRLATTEDLEEQQSSWVPFWCGRNVIVEPQVWELMTNMIYAGQVSEAFEALSCIWPADIPDKDYFVWNLILKIEDSWFAPQLPWFDQIDAVFMEGKPANVEPDEVIETEIDFGGSHYRIQR